MRPFLVHRAIRLAPLVGSALALALVGLGPGSGGGLGAAPAIDPGPRGEDELPEIEAATLEAIRRHPSPHLGNERRVVVQYASPVEHWNPWLTRFGTARHHAHDVWSDAQMVWREEEWADTFPLLFTRTGTLADKTLAVARPHERFELVVVAQEVLLGEPWIEVRSARRLSEYVSEGSILHATRALELLSEGRYELALGEVTRAESGPLPAHALEALDELRVEIERAAEQKGAVVEPEGG